MDDVALRYLLLGLRLGRHVPGFVRSYQGPAQLSEAVAGEPLTPAAELHDESMQLAGLAADLPADTAAQRRRTAWLVAQVGSMSALARLAGGEEIGYVDLVEELYDIEVQLEPEATFDAARQMLDAALPGEGSLRERLAKHDSTTAVPPESAVAMASELAARLRARTRSQLWLPEHESLEIEGTRGSRSVVEARYLGGGRSLVRLDLDRPITLATLVAVATHEGYPGHPAAAVVYAALLVAAGHDEMTLNTGFSPQALVSDGLAGIGREVVMSDQELGAELQRLASSLLRRPEVEVELRVQRARRLLRPALGNAAVALHRDGEPPQDVRAYLAEVALVPDERLEDTFANLTDAVLRTEPFMDTEGRRVVSEWLELHGQTHGLARLLAEQQTPHSLRSELPLP